jgi:hypothetical protein
MATNNNCAAQLTPQQAKMAADAMASGYKMRPMSLLDQSAKELGVWSEEYHFLPRSERHSIVASAYSRARKSKEVGHGSRS